MKHGKISAGNALHLARFIREGHWDKASAALLGAIKTAQTKNCERVLLSSEWLLGSFAHENRLIEFDRLIQKLGAYAFELLLVLRDPPGQFISLYKHRAKSGSVPSIYEWATSGYDLPIRLNSLRRQVAAADVQLSVRGYDKKPGALERLFFEEWLAIPTPPQTSNALVNPSLSLSELVLLRKLRAHHEGLVPFFYERLLKIDPSEKCEGRAIQAHARLVAENAVARHADEWRSWNALLQEEQRFEIPNPQQSPGAEPKQLELSEVQLSVMMKLLADATRPQLRWRLFWTYRLRPFLARIKRLLFPWHSRR